MSHDLSVSESGAHIKKRGDFPCASGCLAFTVRSEPQVTEVDVFTASQLETRSSTQALQDRTHAYSSSLQTPLLPIACLALKPLTTGFAYCGVGGKYLFL